MNSERSPFSLRRFFIIFSNVTDWFIKGFVKKQTRMLVHDGSIDDVVENVTGRGWTFLFSWTFLRSRPNEYADTKYTCNSVQRKQENREKERKNERERKRERKRERERENISSVFKEIRNKEKKYMRIKNS